MHPDINKRCWKEAKSLAMRQEAKVQCAAIRIQAEMRRAKLLHEYKDKKRGAIKIQKVARRTVYLVAHEQRRTILFFDRILRKRRNAARLMAKAWRAHVVWEAYMEEMRRKLAEERRRMHEYRMKLRKKREERESGILHREATTINGTLVQIIWSKKDLRLSSLDMTVVMTIYHAPTSSVFKFEISEVEMKGEWQRRALCASFEAATYQAVF